MAQIPNNINPAGAQAAARPSGISDDSLLKLLALLKIEGKPLALAGSKPHEIAGQIKKGLLEHGFSESDFPKLAISILRDRKAGKVSTDLDLSKSYLKHTKEDIDYSSLLPGMRSRVTYGKIQPKALNVTPEAVAARMTEVKLHPEPPDRYQEPVAIPPGRLLSFYIECKRVGVFKDLGVAHG